MDRKDWERQRLNWEEVELVRDYKKHSKSLLDKVLRSNFKPRDEDELVGALLIEYARQNGEDLAKLKEFRDTLISGGSISFLDYFRINSFYCEIPLSVSAHDAEDLFRDWQYEATIQKESGLSTMVALIDKIIDLEEQRFFPKFDDEIGFYLLKRIYIKQRMIIEAKFKQLVNYVVED